MNEDLSQPWPHPFEPSTASDGAGHIEINPSMLPPTMTPPQTDLDRLNELEAKATPGPWTVYHDRTQNDCIHIGKPDEASVADFYSFTFEQDLANAEYLCALHNAFPAISKELAELREEHQAAKKWNEYVDGQRREARAQLTASQASERRMRGLVKNPSTIFGMCLAKTPPNFEQSLKRPCSPPQ